MHAYAAYASDADCLKAMARLRVPIYIVEQDAGTLPPFGVSMQNSAYMRLVYVDCPSREYRSLYCSSDGSTGPVVASHHLGTVVQANSQMCMYMYMFTFVCDRYRGM